jgi:hypothetical protein
MLGVGGGELVKRCRLFCGGRLSVGRLVREDAMEKKLKHLEMLQNIIDRIAGNSFSLKRFQHALCLLGLLTLNDVLDPRWVLPVAGKTLPEVV